MTTRRRMIERRLKLRRRLIKQVAGLGDMPTRAINLKLVVPRGDRGEGEVAALWATHREINAGTLYYETRLLSMRQGSYLTAEGIVQEKEVKAQAEALLDEARQRNGHEPLSDKSEALLLLRQLYEAMVPAVVGEEGNAQAASRFAGIRGGADLEDWLCSKSSISTPSPPHSP